MATRLTRLARPLSQIRPSSSSILRRRTIRQISQTSGVRASSSSSSSTDPNNSNSPFGFSTGPSPPRLPPDEQAEFERLQRIASTQEGFNATSTPPDFSSLVQKAAEAELKNGARVGEEAEATFVSTPLRKGAPPEFEGDVNPKTGEVGGPKNEPLRWGAGGDYSFNGRVTDF